MADVKRSPGTVTPRRNTLGGAAIILSSGDGVGTNEIMRRTGKSKTCVWQERFMKEGDGLLQDKTRPSRIPPLGPEVAARVVALTLADPPVERAGPWAKPEMFLNRGDGPRKPRLTAGSMQFHKQQRLPKAAVSPFVMHATRNQRFAIALLSSVDERAEHCLDHGFDGRIRRARPSPARPRRF